MMDEEIRQALNEVREMKQMCGNINMKLTNIVTQRGQDFKKKLEAEYQKGFEDGKKEAESSEAIEQAKADAFNKGMLFKEKKINDAFKRGFEKGKAVNDKGCEGCMYQDNSIEHHPCGVCCNAYNNRWTAKQTDDEIKAGDVVIYNGTTKCLVVRPETDERYAVLIDSNGNHHHADHSECKKTGRHFDIGKILEEMRK